MYGEAYYSVKDRKTLVTVNFAAFKITMLLIRTELYNFSRGAVVGDYYRFLLLLKPWGRGGGITSTLPCGFPLDFHITK